MVDSISTGQGNSRNIRAAAASVPATWEEFRLQLINSGVPVDLTLNENGWARRGTELNAATLLADDTAAALGLTPSAATPNNAFAALKDATDGIARIVSPIVSGAVQLTAGIAQRVTLGFYPALITLFSNQQPGQNTGTAIFGGNASGTLYLLYGINADAYAGRGTQLQITCDEMGFSVTGNAPIILYYTAIADTTANKVY